MSKPETIRIDEVEYVRKDSIKDQTVKAGPIKIVILDRGFVYVGQPQYILHREDNTPAFRILKIDNARNIRQWGTTKGLAELVNGPLQKTVLDARMTVYVPAHAVLSLIDVDQQTWTKHI